MYKGYKIKKNKYTLEVERVEEIAENLYSIYYVVKEGNREITTGFVFATKEDYSKVLNDTLNEIVRSLRRVEEIIRSSFEEFRG
ncbi:MAG TPA: hypothetical protein EYG86_05350 [Crocinitomicaceae bacterium]|nr:hypothetical protein [Crocinitomicaceae bacterium]